MNVFICHIAIVVANGKMLWGKTRQPSILLATKAEPQKGDVLALRFCDGDGMRKVKIRVLERTIEGGQFASESQGLERNREIEDLFESYRSLLSIKDEVFSSTCTGCDLYLTCELVGKNSAVHLESLVSRLKSA